MPSKTSEKTKDVVKELEKKISPILVINNSSLKPYVELFEYQPENIYQQPLGILLGFFEVKEYSENSAYIVNFLTSVLKKEYYANAKRSIEESFDAALHKVNLALSELAKHGNIEWLGKLNASICVLEKNGVHFSVAGNARMFLWRAGGLTDISEGLANDESSLHPLKTFVNVSSGRMEKNDRLFITSDDLFQIMTQNELIKNFQRLEKEKFVQFLKTACSNQLEMIASIVVDIREEAKKETKSAMPPRKKKDSSNVFSKAAFEDSPPSMSATKQENDLEESTGNEYTDKKTGHIYVQGENQQSQETGKSIILLEIAKEKIASGWYHAKNITRRRFVLYKKQLSRSLKDMQEKRVVRKIERQQERQLQGELRAKEQEELAIRFEQERVQQEKRAAERKIEVEIIPEIQAEIIQEERHAPKKFSDIAPAQKIEPTIEEFLEEKAELTFAEKLARAKQFQRPEEKAKPLEISGDVEEIYVKVDAEENISKIEKAKDVFASVLEFLKKIYAQFLEYIKSLKNKIHRENIPTRKERYEENIQSESAFVPHLSVIKQTYARFNAKQKTAAFVALILIFIIPLFIARWLNAPQPAPAPQAEQKPADPSEIYANEKNIRFNIQSKTVLQDPSVLTTFVTNSGPIAISKNSIIMTPGESAKNYSFPANSGNAVRATYMKDLAMIFVSTDNGKVISFSPNVQKYSSNNINLSGVSSSSFIGTYLTYLYVLDQQSDRIYRFPRADGGFGDKTSWLKDDVSLSSTSDMTIDDNIYVAQDGQIQKFFKGKKIATNFETSSTQVNFDHIYTTPDINSFYTIDTKNTRLVQYDKASGTITAQYFNTELKDASSLSIDEKNKVAYVTTPSGLISISLQ